MPKYLCEIEILRSRERNGDVMSPKELLYIEDALGHTEESKKCCADFSNQVQDPALKNLFSDLSAKQSGLYAKFYSLLNE